MKISWPTFVLQKTIAALCLLIFSTFQADAGRIPRGFMPPTGATGSVQLNLGADFAPANFINILQTGSVAFFGGALPGTAALDSNGYPTQSFTGGISLTFSSTAWTGVTYSFVWTSGTKLQVTNLGNNSSCSLSGTGGSVTGCTGGNVTLTIDGTGAGSMTFTPTGGFSLQFPGTGTYGAAGTANLKLVRTSDIARTGFITPEFQTALTGSGISGATPPKTIRVMGFDQNSANNSETLFAYRATPTSLSWINQYPPGAWSGGSGNAGTITGTDQYTAAAAPNTTSAGWVAGEVLQGSVSNAQSALITVSNVVNNGSGLCRLTVSSAANITTGQQIWPANLTDSSTNEPMFACSNKIFTATNINSTTIDLQGSTFSGTYKANSGFVGIQTLTVTGKSGGAKFIADNEGLPVGVSGLGTIDAGIGTFFYDDLLDRVLYLQGGIIAGVPIEVSASIANSINANLWATIPPHATDGYVTSWATTVLGALNSQLYFYPEYSNEVWNFGFTQTQWATQRGLALGFTIGSNQAVYGWYGLRVRQIMGNLIPPVWSGRSAMLRRVMAFQAAGDFTTTSTNRFSGAQLAPVGISTGAGNSTYCTFTGGTFSGGTCTGGANFTASPNRPIDVTETIASAPYAGGANLMFGPDIQLNGTPDADNAPFYQALANAQNAGNTSLAVSMVDQDVRLGFSTSSTIASTSGATFTTSSNHGFTVGGFPISTSVVNFQVTGGAGCPGLTTGATYQVTSVPSPTTFTIQAFVNGFPSGANISPGTCSGTVTVALIGNTTTSVETMQLAANTYYQFAQNLSVTFGNKRVEWYEGSLEPVGPSAAQCTELGITGTNPSAAIAAATIAWRNDPTSATTIQAYYQQFMGTDSTMVPTFGIMTNSKTPAHLVLPGPATNAAPWPLLSGPFSNSTPYQLYNGFVTFHSGINWLLKRDVDPASNDNDPMWLEKAA
jgi:hypothetical protein